MSNKPKFDFGDLAPEPSKSDFDKKIERTMDDYRTNKKPELSFFRRPERMRAQNEIEEEIQRDISIIEKGQQCEDDVKYALTYLPREKFRILHNVFIYGKNALGQDEAQEHDAIVITNNYIFDIEAKSVAGDMLTICPDSQWEVKNGRRTYGIPNPVAQIERHRTNLLSKLRKKDVQIIELVVTNNERLLIRNEYGDLPYVFLKTDNLVNFITEIAKDETNLSASSVLLVQDIMSGKRPQKY